MKHVLNFILSIIAVVVFGSCGERTKSDDSLFQYKVAPPRTISYKADYIPLSIYSDDLKQTLNFDIFILISNNYIESRKSFYFDFENQFLRFYHTDPFHMVPAATTRALQCKDLNPSNCMSYEFESPGNLFTEVINLKIGKMEIEQVEAGIKTVKKIYKMKFPTPMTVNLRGMTYSEKEILFIPAEARDTSSAAEILMLNENYIFHDNNQELLKLSNAFELPGQLIAASPNYPLTREFDPSQGKITDTYINSETHQEEKRSWILKFIF